MNEFFCQINELKVIVHCANALQHQAGWLLQTIKNLSDHGKPLVDGTTIQIGWSVLTLQQNSEGLLVLEPDFLNDPFTQLNSDVNNTLIILAQQRDLLRQLDIEGQPSLFSTKVVMAKDSLKLERIYMERTATSSPEDSGWYIGPVEDSSGEDEYEAIYLYELLHHRPELMKVTALPVGYLVVFDGDHLEAVVNEDGTNLLQIENG